MTDAEIRKNRIAVERIIDGIDDPEKSEKIRRTWASFAAKLLLEIVEELDRRIDTKGGAK